MYYLLNHFEIGDIYVFVDISLSPFNFASVSSKYMANLVASDVTLTTSAIQTIGQMLAN